MSLLDVSAGINLPDDFNVVIEVPAGALPVKYEVDKSTGVLAVDRFLSTAMHYPCDYGYIPQTLSDDGDPVDVLVVAPTPLVHGCVVRCRPVGLLNMTDEAGKDAKLLAVPLDSVTPMYRGIRAPEDFPEGLIKRIEHFFERYKELEPGKWVTTTGWSGADAARAEINASVARYADTRAI